jgi:hypothetical protein
MLAGWLGIPTPHDRQSVIHPIALVHTPSSLVDIQGDRVMEPVAAESVALDSRLRENDDVDVVVVAVVAVLRRRRGVLCDCAGRDSPGTNLIDRNP